MAYKIRSSRIAKVLTASTIIYVAVTIMLFGSFLVVALHVFEPVLVFMLLAAALIFLASYIGFVQVYMAAIRTDNILLPPQTTKEQDLLVAIRELTKELRRRPATGSSLTLSLLQVNRKSREDTTRSGPPSRGS